MIGRLVVIAVAANLILSGCGGEEEDGGNTYQPPQKCMTQTGTFTADYAVSKNTCEGFNPPPLAPRDVTFDESGDCGVAVNRSTGTYDNGCTYVETVKITGTDEGFSGTDSLEITCSGSTCEIAYNIHFTRR